MKQEMYANYIKERLGRDYFETEHGFITYQISGEECYIVDIYVDQESRHSQEAPNLAKTVEAIAKSHNCKYLTGSVKPSAHGSTSSVKSLMSFGFKLFKSENDVIWFVKEIV